MSEYLEIARKIIETRWNRRSSLFLLLFLVIIIGLTFFSGIDLSKIRAPEILILSLILLAIAFIWIYTNRVPIVQKGKIGFCIAIATENIEQQKQLRQDFIREIEKLLDRSSLRYNFSFIEYPQYLAQKINSQSLADEYRRKSRCHFMIWGDVRSRKFQGQSQQFLSMEGLVSHGPMPKNIQASLAAEFTELFPRRVIISSEGDIFQFEITAQWINIVATYIIGVAALLSGDIPYSTELFESVYAQTRQLKSEVPALVKIRDRAPGRLTDIYIAYAQAYYNEWMQTKNNELLTKMEPYLANLKQIAPMNSIANGCRSIWLFLVKRDLVSAKAELNRSHKHSDVGWRYNLAFLFAYENNMKQAIKEYRQAFKGYLSEPKILDQITDFIHWVLEIEPQMTQLYFCLGFINRFAKQDSSRALQEFEKFVEVAHPNRYADQIRLANTYIQEIHDEVH